MRYPTCFQIAVLAAVYLVHSTYADDESTRRLSDNSSSDAGTAGGNDSIGLTNVKSKGFGRYRYEDFRFRTPAMIGDFYAGSIGFRGDSVLDRLVVLANGLYAPNMLPGGGSLLTITEPGPLGIFSTSLQSSQQLQGLLRAGSPIPGAALVGVINSNAT